MAKVEGQNSTPQPAIKETDAVYLGTFGNNDSPAQQIAENKPII